MKKIIYCLIGILTFFCSLTNVYAYDFKLNSEKVIMYNLIDDTVLYESKSDVKTSIASLTKIVTAIVVLENIDDIKQKVTIKNSDLEGLIEANASTVGYKVGDVTTYEELLYGLMLPSGADAANALARSVAGSKKEFVELMNKFATKLNLKNTHFANPTGLDDKENYSTLEDLAVIFKYALKNKNFKNIVSTMEYETKKSNLTFTSTIKKTLDKSNLKIKYLKGGKTGTTVDAGLCLASIASYEGVDYMLITVNAPYTTPYNYHILDAKTLYEYYIKNYSYKAILNKDDNLVTIKTKYAKPKQITFKSSKTIKKYLNNDFNIKNVKYVYKGVNEITLLNKKNDLLGKVDIVYNNEILDSIDIKLDRYLTIDLNKYFSDNKLKCTLIIIIITIVIYRIMKFEDNKKKKKRKKKRRLK